MFEEAEFYNIPNLAEMVKQRIEKREHDRCKVFTSSSCSGSLCAVYSVVVLDIAMPVIFAEFQNCLCCSFSAERGFEHIRPSCDSVGIQASDTRGVSLCLVRHFSAFAVAGLS